MKKIFTTAFLSLIFCATLFAKDYVVTSVRGTVKYMSSSNNWVNLKVNDKITGETEVQTGLNSLLEIKGENGEIYKITSMRYGTVDSIISAKNNSSSNANKPKQEINIQTHKIIEDPKLEEELANDMEKSFSKKFKDRGFSSIKNLPANENAVRFCWDSSWIGYEIIELTWTESSATVVYRRKGKTDLEEETEIDIRIERKVTKQDVQKILDIMDKTGFYTEHRYIGTDTRGADIWYIEANIGGSYRSASSFDPPKGSFVSEIGVALRNLAKQK